MFLPALLALSVVAQTERPTIPLWADLQIPEPRIVADKPETSEKRADGIARRTNVTDPRLVVFEPTGPRSDSAAIVVPGGGFGVLADEHEGSDACLWLNKLGVTAFLLQHRCPTNKHDAPNAAPVQDAQRAVQVLRRQASKWKVDPAKIGLLGFSAGGQVAVVAATNPVKFEATGEAPDAHRPAFLVLLYPWQIYDPTRSTPENKGLRADIRLDAPLPPTFIAQCADDKASLPQGSALLALQLFERKVPVELHIYETGGHGFGMHARPGSTGPSDWPLRAADWLRARGIAPAAPAKSPAETK